jgi:hypothetical protein
MGKALGMRVSFRRGIAVTGLCALMAVAPFGPTAAQPTYRSSSTAETPPPPPPPPPKKKSSHFPWWIVAVGVGAAALETSRHDRPAAKTPQGPPDDSVPTRAELLRDGPQVVEEQPFGAYAVYGFVRNGWPIVIDYDSDPQSAVWITITVDGKTWTERLEGGQHYVRIPYRGGSARNSAPALFVVQSAVSGTDPVQPSRLDIVGIGSGPRAVGSVAIHDLTFVHSARKVGGDFAHFAFHASSPFNLVNMDILRYQRGEKNGRPSINVSAVAEYRVSPQPIGDFGPRMWDGLDPRSRQASRGPHRLQVRGWEVEGDESWVSALSGQDVLVP